MPEPRIADIVGIDPPPPQTFGQMAPLRLDPSRYPTLPRALAFLATLYANSRELPPALVDALSPPYWHAVGRFIPRLLTFQDLFPFLRQAAGQSASLEPEEAARAARYKALLEAVWNPFAWQRFRQDPEGYGLPRYSEPSSESSSTEARRP